MIGLICTGKPDFDAIEVFRDDPFFIQSLSLDSVPSSPTVRQRLDSAKGAFNSREQTALPRDAILRRLLAAMAMIL